MAAPFQKRAEDSVRQRMQAFDIGPGRVKS